MWCSHMLGNAYNLLNMKKIKEFIININKLITNNFCIAYHPECINTTK